mmetsp:Transcript_20037/g.62920  ORF Transcript_20037/g.62920 Transcript_20037/m.62920 type:complete len:575 (-) Transcript_20037:1197-2921(-)
MRPPHVRPAGLPLWRPHEGDALDSVRQREGGAGAQAGEAERGGRGRGQGRGAHRLPAEEEAQLHDVARQPGRHHHPDIETRPGRGGRHPAPHPEEAPPPPVRPDDLQAQPRGQLRGAAVLDPGGAAEAAGPQDRGRRGVQGGGARHPQGAPVPRGRPRARDVSHDAPSWRRFRPQRVLVDAPRGDGRRGPDPVPAVGRGHVLHEGGRAASVREGLRAARRLLPPRADLLLRQQVLRHLGPRGEVHVLQPAGLLRGRLRGDVPRGAQQGEHQRAAHRHLHRGHRVGLDALQRGRVRGRGGAGAEPEGRRAGHHRLHRRGQLRAGEPADAPLQHAGAHELGRHRLLLLPGRHGHRHVLDARAAPGPEHGPCGEPHQGEHRRRRLHPDRARLVHRHVRPQHDLARRPLLHLRRERGRLRPRRGRGPDVPQGQRQVRGLPGAERLHARLLHQPGRAQRQHDGAQRALAAGVHRRLDEGGRARGPHDQPRRVPRDRDRARRPHRGRGPPQRHGAARLRPLPHELQVQHRPPGGGRGHRRPAQVHPHAHGRNVPPQRALPPAEPAPERRRVPLLLRHRGH